MRRLLKQCHMALSIVALRSVSTAPPLSLLSWSVDGTEHNYRGCRRRLSLHERIPFLCSTIIEAAPDIVALQNSLPKVAEALCNSDVLLNLISIQKDKKGLSAEATSIEVKNSPQYEQIGFVRNGRCGYLQLFRRSDSVWRGRILLSCPFLTAEFFSVDSPSVDIAAATTENLTKNVVNDSKNSNNNFNNNNSKKYGNTSDALDTSANCERSGTSFVLTNVDLSYRGKSLVVGGLLPPMSSEVSLSGCPFTMRASSSLAAGVTPSARAKGQLDPHREAALAFLSRVARPDVLLGNVMMAREEVVAGYEDAWALAGAPAEHERTINTFARHRHDAETNHYYFLPPVPQESRAAVVIPEEGRGVSVGTQLPLNACWGTHVDGVGPDLSDVADGPAAKESGEGKTNKITPRVSLLKQTEVPQLAGRYQRCLFRTIQSRHHKRHLPFFRRYTRKQLVVLKSAIKVLLTPEEAAQRHESGDNVVRCFPADGFPILVLLS